MLKLEYPRSNDHHYPAKQNIENKCKSKLICSFYELFFFFKENKELKVED